MSSLTTCSGQGVLVQGKEKEKECVVGDIRNESSQQVFTPRPPGSWPSNGVKAISRLESLAVDHQHC